MPACVKLAGQGIVADTLYRRVVSRACAPGYVVMRIAMVGIYHAPLTGARGRGAYVVERNAKPPGKVKDSEVRPQRVLRVRGLAALPLLSV